MMKRFVLSMLCVVGAAGCPSPWTARICTSNASGNCKAIDNADPHSYEAKSGGVGPVTGLTDVAVREPACQANGIGEVDVNVVSRGDLKVTIYCLPDKGNGQMTLAPAPDGGH